MDRYMIYLYVHYAHSSPDVAEVGTWMNISWVSAGSVWQALHDDVFMACSGPGKPRYNPRDPRPCIGPTKVKLQYQGTHSGQSFEQGNMILVGGLEHLFFFHILGIIVPIRPIYVKGVETTNQDLYWLVAFVAHKKLDIRWDELDISWWTGDICSS